MSGESAGSESAAARQPRKPLPRAVQLLIGVAVVWFGTWATWAVHAIVLAALASLLILVMATPAGRTVVDRLVAIIVVAAGILVLVGWISPRVPWLVHPLFLTGLLGTVAVVLYVLRRAPRPTFRFADGVSLATGLAAGIFFWRPISSSQPDKIIDGLFFGYDNPAHYGILRSVWLVHGYEIAVPGSVPDAYAWESYPQGAHQLLSVLASILTSSAQPLTSATQSLQVFAAVSAIQVGFMALGFAWAVDRLTRGVLRSRKVVLGAGQFLVPAVIVLGPAAWVYIGSVSYVTGMALIVPAAVFAATARTRPRYHALLVTAAASAGAAAYPVLGVLLPPIWLLYLWSSRSFWLASGKRKLAAVGVSVAAAIVCAPMFVMLVLRNTDHDWNAFGAFDPLPKLPFAFTGVLLAVTAAIGPRLARAIRSLTWATVFASLAFIGFAIYEWHSQGLLPYYSLKSLYAVWMLAILVIGTAAVFLIARKKDRVVAPARRPIWLRACGLALSLVLAGSALYTGLLLQATPPAAVAAPWWSIAPGAAWGSGAIARYFSGIGLGRYLYLLAGYAAKTDSTPLALPCDTLSNRWLMFLAGGMSENRLNASNLSCRPRPGTIVTPSDEFVAFIRDHPDQKFLLIVTTQQAYDELADWKKRNDLSNVEVLNEAQDSPPPKEAPG